MNKKRGMTLFETMICITIISVLVSMMYQVFLSQKNHHQMVVRDYINAVNEDSELQNNILNKKNNE